MATTTRSASLAMLLSIAVLSISLLGCDAIIDAAAIDVPISVTITGEATNPTIPSADASCSDLSSQQAFADNVARIRGGSVSDVTLHITDLVNPTFTSGTLSSQVFSRVTLTLLFDPEYGDTRVYTLGEFTDVSLADLRSAPRSLALHSDAGDACAKMSTQPKFCVTVSYGAFASGPARADYIRAVIGMKLKFEARTI
jgi:hypothetical protein